MFTVAIIGAGPAGATLARLLLTSSVSSKIQVTLFERDTTASPRRLQGDTLDLHPNTGLAAFRKAGLWDELMKYARYDGEEFLICDKNGQKFFYMSEAADIKGFDARPEIDRKDLQKLLLDSLPPDLIKWGKHLKSVNDGKRTLHFADGSQEGPFDLIVGCDGAWSKVRTVLTDVKPTYSGICSMRSRVTPQSAGEDWEAISQMVGKGNNFNFSDRKALMGQRLGDGSISVSTNRFTDDEEWAPRILTECGDDEVQVRQRLLEHYTDWDDRFKLWFSGLHRFRGWPLYELPLGHRWTHRQGFTVIGDAAHLITPFAGEGVNAAMRDAMDLVEAIEVALSQEGGVDAAVAVFEETMFARMKDFMAGTLRNKQLMFTADAPRTFLSEMVGVAGKEAGYDFDQGLLRFIPIKKIAYGFFWMIGILGFLRRIFRESLKSPNQQITLVSNASSSVLRKDKMECATTTSIEI